MAPSQVLPNGIILNTVLTKKNKNELYAFDLKKIQFEEKTEIKNSTGLRKTLTWRENLVRRRGRRGYDETVGLISVNWVLSESERNSATIHFVQDSRYVQWRCGPLKKNHFFHCFSEISKSSSQ